MHDPPCPLFGGSTVLHLRISTIYMCSTTSTHVVFLLLALSLRQSSRQQASRMQASRAPPTGAHTITSSVVNTSPPLSFSARSRWWEVREVKMVGVWKQCCEFMYSVHSAHTYSLCIATFPGRSKVIRGIIACRRRAI